jgi:hypothetical protein
MPTPDVLIGGGGASITTFTPMSAEAKDWFEENVETETWQWLGESLAVDSRMAMAIIDGLDEAGITHQYA